MCVNLTQVPAAETDIYEELSKKCIVHLSELSKMLSLDQVNPSEKIELAFSRWVWYFDYREGYHF